MTLQRSVRVVQCGLILFLLVFSRYLGTNWRQKSLRIALGFGAFASVELALVAINAATDNVFNQVLSNFINMIAYDATILIWIGYMLSKSPAREPATYMLRPQRWEDGLARSNIRIWRFAHSDVRDHGRSRFVEIGPGTRAYGTRCQHRRNHTARQRIPARHLRIPPLTQRAVSKS